MLLPCAVLDALLILCASHMFVAPLLLLGMLLLLVLLLLLLSMLLPVAVLLLLLLSMLSMRLLAAVLLLLLLGMLLLLVVLLLLLGMLLLLAVFLLWFGLLVLTLFLLGVVLLLVLLLVLCVSRGGDSEKQRQNGCASDLNGVHMSSVLSKDGLCLLAQASSCRVYRAADGFARHEKFHSPVLLAARGAFVGGHGQGVTEASG
jgi:hypothetical protein